MNRDELQEKFYELSYYTLAHPDLQILYCIASSKFPVAAAYAALLS